MQKVKVEIVLVIILIPILVYVGWQAYNTYLKPPPMDLEELEMPEEIEEKPTRAPAPEPAPRPKGTLDYTGYIERDPLKHSLPVKIKKKPKVTKVPKKAKEVSRKKKKPPKVIALPKFSVTGIVWGKPSPRAIIDNRVYKTGDVIKGAKILDITKQGIHMIYQEQEFWVTVQKGG